GCERRSKRLRAARLQSRGLSFDTRAMAPSAPISSTESAASAQRDNGSGSLSLTETLRRALAEIDAAAIGVARPTGGKPKYFTRTAAAAQFFEEICATGLDALQTQANASHGVVGTNRVRSNADGPVRGRLIALALRDANGTVIGLLLAIRTIDQAKF